jgi:hypothetical protein
MTSGTFLSVLAWLRQERALYQTDKFDYQVEADRPVEYWEQQFDSYIQRLRVFPTDSLQHAQAALKLAATAVAYAEHATAKTGCFPAPGVPSGVVTLWKPPPG